MVQEIHYSFFHPLYCTTKKISLQFFFVQLLDQTSNFNQSDTFFCVTLRPQISRTSIVQVKKKIKAVLFVFKVQSSDKKKISGHDRTVKMYKSMNS